MPANSWLPKSLDWGTDDGVLDAKTVYRHGSCDWWYYQPVASRRAGRGGVMRVPTYSIIAARGVRSRSVDKRGRLPLRVSRVKQHFFITLRPYARMDGESFS